MLIHSSLVSAGEAPPSDIAGVIAYIKVIPGAQRASCVCMCVCVARGCVLYVRVYVYVCVSVVCGCVCTAHYLSLSILALGLPLLISSYLQASPLTPPPGTAPATS